MRAPSRRHPLALASVLALGVVAAACGLPTPAPPPGPTSSPCSPQAQPSPSHPVDYAAAVEDAGHHRHVVTFRASSEAEKDQKVQQLQQREQVLAVEQDKPVHALAVSPADDPLYSSQWGLARAQFPTAWTNGYDGSGETIAIVDTGVQASHEDLTGKVLAGHDFVTSSPVDDGLNSNGGNVDYNGHGTHVAGIAAALDNTVGGLGGAPGASILPVRVLNQSGSGTDATVASGIDWAVDHGAKVINLSLGGPDCSSTEKTALDYAKAHGVVVVAAAGNDGSSTPEFPGGFSAWTGHDVIAVGATTNSNPPAKASYSNFGTWVDIGAPGGNATSTTNGGVLSTYSTAAGSPGACTGLGTNGTLAGYACLSGTSMATPFTTAAAALVLQHCTSSWSSLTPDQVVDHLRTILTSTAGPAVSGLGGAGLLNAGAATAGSC